MRKLALLLVLAAAGCARTLEPSWIDPAAALAQEPDPDHPATVLLKRQRLLFDADEWRTEMHTHYVVAVHAERGIHQASVRLVVPRSAVVRHLRARTIHADATTDELSADQILTQDQVRGEEDDDASVAYVFRVPGVVVGDVIEYDWVIDFEGLWNEWAERVATHVPIRRYEAYVVGTSTIRNSFVVYNRDVEIERVNDGDYWRLRFVMDDVPASEGEDFAGHWTLRDPWWMYRAKAYVYPRSVSKVSVTHADLLDGWTERIILDESGIFDGFGLEVDDEGCADVLCKVERALRLVRAKTELTGFGEVTEARPMEAVLRTARASSAEKNMLLYRLLRDAGVEVAPAATTRRMSRRFEPRFPMRGAFNHLLVRVVPQPGAPEGLWLDASCEWCAPGELPTWAEEIDALVFDGGWDGGRGIETEGEFEHVRGLPSDEGLEKHSYRLWLGEDGSVRLDLERAHFAANAIGVRGTRDWTPAQWEEDARELALGLDRTASVLEHRPLSCDELRRACTRTLSARLERFAIPDAGGRLTVPLSFASRRYANAFGTEKRRHPLIFEERHRFEEEIRLELPSGWVVEHLPAAYAATGGGLSAHVEAAVEGSEVVIRRRMIHSPGIHPASTFDRHREVVRGFAALRTDAIVLRRGGGR